MRSDRRSRAQLLVAITTALLAIVAGVAIAELPGDRQAGDVVVSSPAPDSTDTVSPTSITAAPGTTPTTSFPLPSTTVTTSTTVPAPTTSTTVPTSTTVTTSTTSPTSTTVPTSSTVTTSTTIDGGLLPRAELDVATANASGVDGVAGAAAERLLEIGYPTVSAINAFSPQETSVVYHQPDLVAEAVRLAVDLGWSAEAVAPMDEMPGLDSQQVFELVAVIGVDRARA